MKKTSDNWLNDLRRERLQSSSRNPGAAALMSFFIMGMGQIYAGHIDRGIALMGFHFSGIFAVYSLYNNGLLYEALFPYLGAHLLVMCSYVASVFFILLWIYNIKDAYYLSLFSSFRDWFEVERVLLPMLKEQPGSLLTGPTVNVDLLEDDSEKYDLAHENASEPAFAGEVKVDEVAAAASVCNTETGATAALAEASEDAEEADVLEFRIDRKTQPKKLEKRRPEEKSETAHVVSGRDFEAVGTYGGSSWRLYAGLVVIFLLIGIWFNNRQAGNIARSNTDSTTLFSVSANLGEKTDADQIKVAQSDGKNAVAASDSISGAILNDPSGVPGGNLLAAAADSSQQQRLQDASDPRSNENGSENAEPVTGVEEQPVTRPEEPPFMKGLELVRNGSTDEAAILFEADLKVAEPTEDSWKVVLNTFYRTDNKVAYEMNLRRYLKKYSNDAAAWFNLGKLLYDRNELVQAAQAIAGGLKAEPDNVRGNFLLGSIYNDLKLYEDSAVYLLRAVNLEPLNIEFNRQLARALSSSGKPKDAVKYYQRVNSLAPEDKEARQAIAASRPEMAMAFSPDETDENQVLVVMGKSESRLIEKNVEDMPIQQTGKVLYESPDAGEDANALSVQSMTDSVPLSQPQEVAIKTPLQPASVGDPVIKAIETPEMTVVSDVSQTVPKPVPKPETKPETKLETKPEPGPEPATAAETITKPAVSPAPEVTPNPASEAGKDDFRDAVATTQDPAKGPPQKSSRIEEFRQKGSYEFSRGNWEAALPHYLSILKEKKDAQTYDIVSLIFEKLSMNRDAFDAIEHAYRMGMRDSSTLAKLGRLAELNSDFKKGEYYLYHALQKIPHRVDLRIRYARCLEANGRGPIALKELEKIVRASGDSYAVRRRAELEMQKIKSRQQPQSQ